MFPSDDEALMDTGKPETHRLTEEVLRLAPDDQRRLVERVLNELDPEDGDVTAAWVEEIEARVAAAEAGDVAFTDAGEVLAATRARLQIP
jgi:putative addiction module component (TIGR02574 family)